ncbi:MAG: phosphoribosylamine--glycine ligase [Bacillota bacterium]|nr:phosphoribosylamine--glycine ligase [Bacillota bacterium]
MKVLIIGGGGREHAIAWKLAQSPKAGKIWCAPGNGGISEVAECVPVKATDLTGVLEFCKKNNPDLVVVAPDDPLMLGMVDMLQENGFRAFGPKKNAALIEGSKAFAKELMQKYDIPTAGYEVFDDQGEAFAYIKKNGAPIVVKADGLALGKGVTVAMTEEEAENAVKAAMEDGVFGSAGKKVVIEEYLTGPEVSVLCFTDGETLRLMPSAQDHKRAFDGDKGPNTGGMGAFSPSVNYTKEIEAQCMERIFLPTIRAMKAENRPFQGVLYFGLMLTSSGPKVIEYNARFGDPETQAVLTRMKSDLLDAMNAVVDGTLKDADISFSDDASCCVVMASGGYPVKYETGFPIGGISDARKTGAVIFHAGTKLEDGVYKTSGGRVLGVTATGKTAREAAEKAYEAVGGIRFDRMHYRRDIG